MKKLIYLSLLLFTSQFLYAQNTGIGTTTPQEKLEVKNPLRSTVKISSNNYNDTSQLILSNRNASNEGTDFKITSIREQGLRVSSLSDLPEQSIDPILLIRPTGQVGIGTTSPQEKLEVKNASRSTVKISSNNFLDTTQLILSNRSPGNAGIDFNISSIQENGLKISTSSDIGAHNIDPILMIRPNGLVGVRNPNPTEVLDVTGNINVTGTIKANGTDGSAGQILMKNNSGNLAWGSIQSDFKYFTPFWNPGLGQTWVVPAGVSTIGVEIWGGGGGGNNAAGGSGGGYLYGLVHSVTPGETITVDVGNGGAGNTSSNADDGTESRLLRGGIILRALGGNGATSSSAGAGGGTYNTNAGSGLVSYLGRQGSLGSVTEVDFAQSDATKYVKKFRYGNGGDAGNAPGTGGKGGYQIINAETSAFILNYHAGNTSAPGGGGAGSLSGKGGAAGLVIIYY